MFVFPSVRSALQRVAAVCDATEPEQGGPSALPTAGALPGRDSSEQLSAAERARRRAAAADQRVQVQMMPSAAPRSSAVGEAAASALAAFGLRLLLSALQRGVLQGLPAAERAAMLDPFVPLLAEGLRAARAGVLVHLSLQCLALMMRPVTARAGAEDAADDGEDDDEADAAAAAAAAAGELVELPSMKAHLSGVVSFLFTQLRVRCARLCCCSAVHSRAALRSQTARGDVLEVCFRALAAVLRWCPTFKVDVCASLTRRARVRMRLGSSSRRSTCERC